jgi:hypothetical protein
MVSSGDCTAHKWIEAEINGCKAWRAEHVKEHKEDRAEVAKVKSDVENFDRTIWKWGAAIFAFQAAVGTLAAIAMFGHRMGWF